MLTSSLLAVTLLGAAGAQSVPPSPSETSEACSAVPTSVTFSDDGLPDPFKLIDGTAVTSLDAWDCRREELRSLIQSYEIGPKPPRPDITSSFQGNTLSITSAVDGKSMTFSVTIRLPTTGTAPFPAIIGYQGGSIPVPDNVALISYDNDELASTTSATHGVGAFYDLYGTDSASGGLAAWAWGVSRILDALEQTPEADVDASRVGVTGCSRNGKGAMVAGALDDRVALTIPQEGGSGGAGCWRVVQAQKDAGETVETAAQIVTGDAWFSPRFSDYVNTLDVLPFDNHELMGLVAPRGLLVVENSEMKWLGDMSTYGCSMAARLVYGALGAEANMGYSQVGHADHCGFPASQAPELTAFIDRFLGGGEGAVSDVFKTDGTYAFELSEWVNWTTPDLAS